MQSGGIGKEDIARAETLLASLLVVEPQNPSVRYLRAQISYAPVQGSLAYIRDFVPTIDTAPTIETGNSLTVGAGGTTIVFPTQFHIAPQVIATCISNASLVASVASVSATGCTFHVWNSSGVDVGGVINYEAIGE